MPLPRQESSVCIASGYLFLGRHLISANNFGTRIARDMSNPYGSWLIESETSSWRANEHFGRPSSLKAGAALSPDRFGLSRTTLPDGREVLTAGEQEDFYAPDFSIYNAINSSEGRLPAGGSSRRLPPVRFP